MNRILTGKEVSEKIGENIVKNVEKLRKKGVEPTLAIVRVGENPSDVSYEKTIEKQGEKWGVEVVKTVFYDNVPEKNVLKEIQSYVDDETVHGIMLFRPLPKKINEDKARNLIPVTKDVDCISDSSLGGVFLGSKDVFSPCTAQAVIEILKFYNVKIKGKKVAIVGRSLVVGKPLAMLILNENGTPTVCHSKTENLREITKSADIVVVALGKAKFLDDSYFKENQTVIDVGINVDKEGNLCGDVDFNKVESKVLGITPVPNGVGGVTTTVLMSNVVEVAKKSLQK